MKATGFYEWMKDGELKVCSATMESTGIKDVHTGKVIWRKLKNGKPQNIFAEQVRPNVPWATGRWFLKVNGGVILEQYPNLKVDTDTSKGMTDSEYIEFLKHTFEI